MTKFNQGRGPLLNHLDEIEARCLQGDPTLKDIFNIFGPDGHYVLIAFLNIPFLQPIPIPGLSTPFGLLMAVISILAYFNKPPWLPKSWTQKRISAKTVSRISESSERVFKMIARILHPRWKFLFQEPFRTLNTFLLVFNAVLLALPLPVPLSNALPAWMIAFQTLGYLEEDGLFMVLSYVQSIMCFGYFFFLFTGARTGIEFLGLW
jgi:hypothetical protein